MKNIFLVLLLVFVLAGGRAAFADVAIDSVGSGNNSGGATSGSFSFTNSAGTYLYLCAEDFTGNHLTSASYNGVAMTHVYSGTDTDIWRLDSPAVGSHTIAWGSGATMYPVFNVATFTGVDSGAPDGASTNAAASTVALSSTVAGSMFFTCGYFNGAAGTVSLASGNNLVNITQNSSDTSTGAGAYQAAPTVTSYTNGFVSAAPFDVASVEILPTGGGGGGSGGSATTTTTVIDDPAEQLFDAFLLYFLSMAFIIWLMRK